MLQEFNQNHNDKVSVLSSHEERAELRWWRSWSSSWWANVYF